MIRYHQPAPAEPAADSAHALRESIVRDYERLDRDSRFKFGCHPGVPCFNDCCSDVNIFLTPYDVLRLKNRLGLTSGEFLVQHTVMPVHEAQRHPVVVLKMTEDEAKRCPFVSAENGCTVYEDRPWACRMFPVGKASPQSDPALAASPPEHGRPDDTPFYFLMSMEVCRGWDEGTEWTVGRWMDDQQVEAFDRAGDAWKDLTLHPFFEQGGQLNPQQMDMFHMVCFDLDRFREFVFGSSLLKRVEVDNALLCRMRRHDDALLEFGYLWLRFALFHEPALRVKR